MIEAIKFNAWILTNERTMIVAEGDQLVARRFIPNDNTSWELGTNHRFPKLEEKIKKALINGKIHDILVDFSRPV